MPRIRHIAYRSQDPEAMAQFFVAAFEMAIAERQPSGAIGLSDGTLNVTILPIRPSTDGTVPRPGIEHLGFTVEDDDATKAQLLALGSKELTRIGTANHHNFELKFEGPEGIVVDVGHWPGTAPLPGSSRIRGGARARRRGGSARTAHGLDCWSTLAVEVVNANPESWPSERGRRIQR